MNIWKRVAGYAIGVITGIVVYFGIQFFTASDKLAPFQEFRSDAGSFSILMPGKPASEKQNLETPAGSVAMVMYTAGSGNVGCVVAFADYPQKLVDSSDPQKLLDGAQNGAIKNVKGKLVKETRVSFNGLPARDVVIEVPGKAFVTARLIIASPRFYQIMLITPTDKGHEQDISKFFNSFRIDGIN
jgi:hypothetical protein